MDWNGCLSFVASCSQKYKEGVKCRRVCALNLQASGVNWATGLVLALQFRKGFHWQCALRSNFGHLERKILQNNTDCRKSANSRSFCSGKYSLTNLAMSEQKLARLLLVVISPKVMVSVRLFWNPGPHYTIPMDAFQLPVGHTKPAGKQKNKVCCDNVWM